MTTIKTLIIKFKNEITPNEISGFRGAVVQITEGSNILFHNHIDDKTYRYSYPLIQYHRIHKCASIVCIGDGTDAIGDFFSNLKSNVKIGEKSVELAIDNVKAAQTTIRTWDTMFTYKLTKWLPLNSRNFEKYKTLEGLVKKTEMLEKIFIGNILSFTKGVGIHVNSKILCNIIWFEELHSLEYKGAHMTAFNVMLKSNISIPDFISLGKGASLGFGSITRVRASQSQEKNTSKTSQYNMQ